MKNAYLNAYLSINLLKTQCDDIIWYIIIKVKYALIVSSYLLNGYWIKLLSFCLIWANVEYISGIPT